MSKLDLLEYEIEQTLEWWKDKELVAELERRDAALESGEDKGYTLAALNDSIKKLRVENIGSN